MPELPDVEIARRHLHRWLTGATVTAAACTDACIARPGKPGLFARTLTGRVVAGVSRKGKWLRVDLDDGRRLFSHLGMTGDWVRVARGAPAQRSERARIDVSARGRDASVRYVDPRRFGRLIAAWDDIDDWASLGPDPLAEGIDVGRLASILASTRRSVKEVLMDQRVLAGVGNILATEALWMARIDPRSAGRTLSVRDARGIADRVRQAIQRELPVHRAARDLRSQSFLVYGKAGRPCPRCGERVASVVLGGRTTAFCPKCQASR